MSGKLFQFFSLQTVVNSAHPTIAIDQREELRMQKFLSGIAYVIGRIVYHIALTSGAVQAVLRAGEEPPVPAVGPEGIGIAFHSAGRIVRRINGVREDEEVGFGGKLPVQFLHIAIHFGANASTGCKKEFRDEYFVAHLFFGHEPSILPLETEGQGLRNDRQARLIHIDIGEQKNIKAREEQREEYNIDPGLAVHDSD